MITCWRCGGSGFRSVEETMGNADVPCPNCRGTAGEKAECVDPEFRAWVVQYWPEYSLGSAYPAWRSARANAPYLQLPWHEPTKDESILFGREIEAGCGSCVCGEDVSKGAVKLTGFWVIKFDDADMEDEVFTDGAAAAERHKQLSQNWQVALFVDAGQLFNALRSRSEAKEEIAEAGIREMNANKSVVAATNLYYKACSERDEYKRKGEDLCSVLGNLLIHIHELGLRQIVPYQYHNERAEKAERELASMKRMIENHAKGEK